MRSRRATSKLTLEQIIDDVHAKVDRIRKWKKLPPWNWNNRMENLELEDEKVVKVEAPAPWPPPPEPTYSEAEIQEVYAAGGSVRVHLKVGEKKIRCACNCGAYVPATSASQGWRYIRGHKDVKLNRHGYVKNGSDHSKPVTSGEVYSSYIERIRMDLAQVDNEMNQIETEAKKLTLRLQELKVKREKLKSVEVALSGLATPPKVNGAQV